MIEIIVTIIIALTLVRISFQLDEIFHTIDNGPDVKEPIESFVSSPRPDLMNEQAAGNADDSVIITPKTPQLVAWEEEQQLQKMNMGKPR
jgi:hypothetical protein